MTQMGYFQRHGSNRVSMIFVVTVFLLGHFSNAYSLIKIDIVTEVNKFPSFRNVAHPPFSWFVPVNTSSARCVIFIHSFVFHVPTTINKPKVFDSVITSDPINMIDLCFREASVVVQPSKSMRVVRCAIYLNPDITTTAFINPSSDRPNGAATADKGFHSKDSSISVIGKPIHEIRLREVCVLFHSMFSLTKDVVANNDS